jgi:hypothetical protein
MDRWHRPPGIGRDLGPQPGTGHLALGPTVPAEPTFSTLNFPSSDVRANGVAVALGGSGGLSNVYVASGSASTHVVFDVTGFFR